MIDGRTARGERTRVAVLDTAVGLASVLGLDAMSLARLADETGVSKSALFAHWQDKEILQLAVVEHAVQLWMDRVVRPALRTPRGVRRLWALHERRLAFYADKVLPGGCFFAATEPEFDDRPGPVRDALVAAVGSWLRLLRTVAAQAVDLGELRADTDVGQLAFETEALGKALITSTWLSREHAAEYARRAVLDRLRQLSPTPELLPDE
ncbi:MAG TPA: TetR/AcrR family transcriptional regulator [Trebonia sp.]